jgi:hypothetical protein
MVYLHSIYTLVYASVETKSLSGPTIHNLLQDTDLIGEINSVYNFTYVSLFMNSPSLPRFPLLSSSQKPRKSKPPYANLDG